MSVSARVPCPRCGTVPPFMLNNGVSLDAHYDDAHPTVPFMERAREIVTACR